MARQIGVDLTIWSHVRKEMAVLEIDELDIMHALQSCRVEEVEVLGVVERCRATGRDTDGRFLRVLLVACAEQLAIEVISVEMREEEK